MTWVLLMAVVKPYDASWRSCDTWSGDINIHICRNEAYGEVFRRMHAGLPQELIQTPRGVHPGQGTIDALNERLSTFPRMVAPPNGRSYRRQSQMAKFPMAPFASSRSSPPSQHTFPSGRIRAPRNQYTSTSGGYGRYAHAMYPNQSQMANIPVASFASSRLSSPSRHTFPSSHIQVPSSHIQATPMNQYTSGYDSEDYAPFTYAGYTSAGHDSHSDPVQSTSSSAHGHSSPSSS